MALTWDEIRKRAVHFSREWAGEAREAAEASTFWNEFFDVFGLRRRRVATFQEPVKLLKKKRGFIDLFWRGVLLVEHKSLGESLESAYAQALNYLFGERRQPGSNYILVPRHSSEHRPYIPMAIRRPTDIAGDSCAVVASEDLYVFGVLMSAMHMAWVRQVGGRIKSDFRYSNEIVYNNYPWPRPTAPQRDAVREAAQAVLDARALYPTVPLGTLYDAGSMPPELVQAHSRLDRAVDRCYRTAPFKKELVRLEHLFALYAEYLAPLAPVRVERPAHARKARRAR